MRIRFVSRALTATLLPVALGACTVGPAYRGAPALGQAAPPAAFVRAGDAAVPVSPGVARWWLALGDPLLDRLEERALAANPDLAAAQARVRQARAALSGQRAAGRPAIGALGAYLHARLPGLDLQQGDDSGGSSNVDFYNDGLSASWEIDLFGGRRRSVEVARASADQAGARLADAQVSVAAEVAQAYAGLRDRQRRIALAARSIALGEQIVVLERQRFAAGTATGADVDQAVQQLSATRAETAQLATQRDGFRDGLAILIGLAPGALDAELDARLDLGQPAIVPLPPAQVAVGDPASLLRNRPDIRAAERQLAADTARIGVAEAARFPQVKFLGFLGFGGTGPGDLVDPGKLTALLAPQINWSFLDFGRTKARVSQAEAVRDEAEAKYRAAVLAALRDAEGALARYRDQRIAVADRARALAAATGASALAEQRAAAGTATRIETAGAEQRRIAAEQALAADEAALTIAFITVQKALGLGWR